MLQARIRELGLVRRDGEQGEEFVARCKTVRDEVARGGVVKDPRDDRERARRERENRNQAFLDQVDRLMADGMAESEARKMATEEMRRTA